jgi:hypothetical protein
MPFIGNQPAEKYSSFQKQDFTTSATTSYTLDHPVANGNEIALFINFVRQEPTAAYTASGTSLTLTSATSSSDDMYCVYLGKAVQTVNPPSGSVGTAQLASDAVTTAKINDNAVTSGKMFSTFKNGITEADQWRLTANYTYTGSGDLDSNLERVDTSGWGKIGTGMSQSSGIFTFPSTGIYLVKFNTTASLNGDRRSSYASIKNTTNNSTYNSISTAVSHIKQSESNTTFIQLSTETLLDVTDTSNHKVKFNVFTSATTLGDTDVNYTHMMFIRLGDT